MLLSKRRVGTEVIRTLSNYYTINWVIYVVVKYTHAHTHKIIKFRGPKQAPKTSIGDKQCYGDQSTSTDL